MAAFLASERNRGSTPPADSSEVLVVISTSRVSHHAWISNSTLFLSFLNNASPEYFGLVYYCYAQITESSQNQPRDPVLYVKFLHKFTNLDSLCVHCIGVVGEPQLIWGWVFVVAKVGVRNF